MQRNQNINKVRAIACLMVLIYHCWALCGSAPVGIPVLGELLAYGGSIGVTLFFALSGYGIYCSLYATEQSGKPISFRKFMAKRIQRIVPHYYLNLLVALLFTGSAIYIAKSHLINIVSHLFFLHSFNIGWHGAINGVLWTMAIIFQYYLIAIPLYHFLKKFKIWAVIITVAFSVGAHYLTVNYFWVVDETVYGSFAYMIPGKQIWTTLDNFLMGMYVAYLINTKKKETSSALCAAGCVLCVGAMYLLCRLGNTYGFWGRTLWTASCHSLFAAVTGVFLFCAGNLKDSPNSIPSRFLLWIGKYEYGIYLWHLLIMNNLLAHSSLLQAMLMPGRRIVAYVILLSASVFTGYVMTNLISGKPLLPVKAFGRR